MVMQYIGFVLLKYFLVFFSFYIYGWEQTVHCYFLLFLFLFRTQRVLTPPFSDLVLLENGLAVKRMMQTLWLLRCCSHQYQGIKMSSGTARIAAVLEEGGLLIWPRNFYVLWNRGVFVTKIPFLRAECRGFEFSCHSVGTCRISRSH